jgi:PPM family protein phosphatase
MTPPTPAERRAPEPGAEEARLCWSGMTHVGRFRPNNEDSFLGLKFDGHEVSYLGKTGTSSLDGADFVFAVSDGMGGAKSGEFASKITVDRVTKFLPRNFRLPSGGMQSEIRTVLGSLIESIHRDLLHLGYSYAECAGMGATLSLIWIRPGWAYFAHVGDSRIYHLSHTGELTQLTDDHTHVGWLRREGKINEREARMHPRRNALTQSLGAGTQFVEPHIGAVSHQPGERLLICSDGLVDGLWDRRIAEVLRDGASLLERPDAARDLVEEAVRESGRDNTTAVLIEFPGRRG